MGARMRRLAVVSDYEQLVMALRARAEALNISNMTIDETAGLPSGYAGKLLSICPNRTLGRVSLGCLLAVLGLRLVVEEDPAALDRVRPHLTPRKGGPRRGAGLRVAGLVNGG
jgi:hypothetical protein